ncbi:hypothetical protein [Parasphingopyxis sp.]|uniref:hypothetical protein n=1 Tax=Parasphingopyxis sp. TaxID=1920299 RepID=UPI00260FAB12|nr:hypothetical protein [Parasphingopyxis sp.]
MTQFEGIEPVPEEHIENSKLQNAMLFELSMVRAENLLDGNDAPDWDSCLRTASERQRRHYDAELPNKLSQADQDVATLAADNLVAMITAIRANYPDERLEHSPAVPGLGWIASGNGDLSLGPLLIEVKHTNRNFISGDFRQTLMYWLLKYANVIENDDDIWSELLLLNPRRNTALSVRFDYLLDSASSSSTRVELVELLRSIVGQEAEHR